VAERADRRDRNPPSLSGLTRPLMGNATITGRPVSNAETRRSSTATHPPPADRHDPQPPSFTIGDRCVPNSRRVTASGLGADALPADQTAAHARDVARI
jgi:hypothetical protein